MKAFSMIARIPTSVKQALKSLRSRLLSFTLRVKPDYSLSEEELRASEAISVIVAVHDSPDVTARCLESLELLGGKVEVIVVDDASRLTETRELLDDACSRNGWKLIRHEAALGHSRASEAGANVSTRPYLCLLNSDTVVTPHSWLGIVQAFESDPQIAVCGPSTSCTFGPQMIRRAMHCRYYWSDEQIWSFAEQYVGTHRTDPLVPMDFVGGFAFFVRRTVWMELNGFDDNLSDYGNEGDFCQRVLQAGQRIVWSRASYIHHLGGTSYRKTLGKDGIIERRLRARAYIEAKANAQRELPPVPYARPINSP